MIISDNKYPGHPRKKLSYVLTRTSTCIFGTREGTQRLSRLKKKNPAIVDINEDRYLAGYFHIVNDTLLGSSPPNQCLHRLAHICPLPLVTTFCDFRGASCLLAFSELVLPSGRYRQKENEIRAFPR